MTRPPLKQRSIRRDLLIGGYRAAVNRFRMPARAGRVLGLTRSTKARSRANQISLWANPGKLALRPLGFGTTKTRAPSMTSGFTPAPGVADGPMYIRYRLRPTKATTEGCQSAIFRVRITRPRAISAGVSSAAVRVVRAQRLVSAMPSAARLWSSS